MKLPARAGGLLAIGAAIACFAIASALTVAKVLDDGNRAFTSYRTGIWAAVQSQVELLKFRNALERYVHDGLSHDALMERYDILWSRFPLLLTGRESETLRRSFPNLTGGVADAFRRMQAIEPALASLRPHDDAALARIEPELVAIEGATQELVLTAVHHLSEIGRFREVLKTRHELIAYVTVSILAGLALIVLLIRQHNRALRLYESAHAAEERAAAVRLDYLQAIESMGDGFALFDEIDRLVLCNERFRDLYAHIRDRIVPGERFESLIRTSVAGHFYPLSPEQTAFWIERRMERHRAPGEAFTHETRDGRTLRIQEYRTRFGGTVIITTDITAERRAERERAALAEQLHQARKMEAVGTLAGGIAHDFNNILTSILGNAALAEIDLPRDHACQDMIKEILTAGERARLLVRQILTFSRSGDQSTGPVRLDVVVKEAAAMLRATLPSTIALEVEIAAEAPTILADTTQLHQIVMNLSVNASHAIGAQPGTIRLRAEEVCDGSATRAHPANRGAASPAIDRLDKARSRMTLGRIAEGPRIRLTVTDSGCGMDHGTLSRIFDPFFTTKPVGQGTGLGLAAVQGIVAALKGVIVVDTAPGAGTTFTIDLPKAPPAALPADEAPPPMRPGKGAILFVDDEPSVAKLGQKTLERAGYTVESMVDSEDALQTFRSSPDRWDMVITDLTMPRMTGLAMARTMLDIRPDLPIVLCTGFSESVSEADAKASGITEFLMKPVVGAELAGLVARTLNRRARTAAAGA